MLVIGASVTLMDSLIRYASKLSHSPDPDCSGPKGDPGTVFRVPDRTSNGKGHKCIHICGLPVAADQGLDSYRIGTSCRYFCKIAGNLFESSATVSQTVA